MKKKKFIRLLIMFVSLMISCDYANKQLTEKVVDTLPLSPQNNAKIIMKTYSHEDSISNWAMGDYYFGELGNTNIHATPSLGGIEFNTISNLRYSYEFCHTITDTGFEKPDVIVKNLYDVLSYKYGVPQRLNDIETHDDLFGEVMGTKITVTKRNIYQWNTEWKKIIISTEERDNKTVRVNLEIVNLKMEKEHEMDKQKRRMKDKVEGVSKI